MKTFKNIWESLTKNSDDVKKSDWIVKDFYKGHQIVVESGTQTPYFIADDLGGGSFKSIQDARKYIDNTKKSIDNTTARNKDYEKNTVHITYDQNGVPVNSYVDENETEKSVPSEIICTYITSGGKQVTRTFKSEAAYNEFKRTVGDQIKILAVDNNIKKAMTNGEDEYVPNAEFGDDVQKPGESIHSEEWDACVREVQSKVGNAKANAYAVCTAKLGDTAFKSQVRHLAYVKSEIKKARKEVEKMGIEAAGPIPNSELARQDLEGEADDEENRVQNEKYDVAEN